MPTRSTGPPSTSTPLTGKASSKQACPLAPEARGQHAGSRSGNGETPSRSRTFCCPAGGKGTGWSRLSAPLPQDRGLEGARGHRVLDGPVLWTQLSSSNLGRPAANCDSVNRAIRPSKWKRKNAVSVPYLSLSCLGARRSRHRAPWFLPCSPQLRRLAGRGPPGLPSVTGTCTPDPAGCLTPPSAGSQGPAFVSTPAR